MDSEQILQVAEAIAADSLAGTPEGVLLDRFCTRLVEAGVPIHRAMIGVDTLHPLLDGRTFEWRDDLEAVAAIDYQRGDLANSEEEWTKSTFHHMWEARKPVLRRRLDDTYRRGEFPILDTLSEGGATDYLARLSFLGGDAQIGEIDCIYSSWTSRHPNGFSDAQVAALERLLPCLAAAIHGACVAYTSDTLMHTYLGRDAGRRVLGGHIERGTAETIRAAIWYSDLRGFTRIADTAPPDQTLALLNDYAECVVTAVQDHGGQVLKFIGDGILAIFELVESSAGNDDGCSHALDAAHDALERIAALNVERGKSGLPVTGLYLSLHVGEVLYGNIGSRGRLDFTVVGPAVNEAARICAMCRGLERDVVVSAAFAAASGSSRDRLVSLGRYALRGVRRPQELFTPDPES